MLVVVARFWLFGRGTTIVIILHFIMVTLVLIRAGVGRGRVLM